MCFDLSTLTAKALCNFQTLPEDVSKVYEKHVFGSNRSRRSFVKGLYRQVGCVEFVSYTVIFVLHFYDVGRRR